MKDFHDIPRTVTPKVKVGIVGEIYVKYSPLGNNGLEAYLESQDCEYMVPGDWDLYNTALPTWKPITNTTGAKNCTYISAI